MKHLRRGGHDVLEIRRDIHEYCNENLGHVIYCVGMTSNFISRPFDTVESHVSLLSKCLQDSEYESFLYLSSTRVYMGSESTHESAMLSVSPLIPTYLYNVSKILGESLCLSVRNPRVRIARVSNVVSSADISTNFLATITKQAKLGRIHLQSDPMSSKDYISLDDVVYLLELISLKGSYRLYNVASGILVRNSEWIEKLSMKYDFEVHVEGEFPVSDAKRVHVGRVRSDFSYIPTNPLLSVEL